MPSLTKAHGKTIGQFEAVGRTVYQYELASVGMDTTPNIVGSNFQKIINACQQYGTVEMIGQVSYGADGQASATKVVLFLSGNEVGVHPLAADLTAANTGAAQNCTVTLIATYTAPGTAV